MSTPSPGYSITVRVQAPAVAGMIGDLTTAIGKAGGDPRHAVMIGDSRTDVATAKAADTPVIVVSFGYSEISVQELGANRVVDHFDELVAAVHDCVAVAEPA